MLSRVVRLVVDNGYCALLLAEEEEEVVEAAPARPVSPFAALFGGPKQQQQQVRLHSQSISGLAEAHVVTMRWQVDPAPVSPLAVRPVSTDCSTLYHSQAALHFHSSEYDAHSRVKCII